MKQAIAIGFSLIILCQSVIAGGDTKNADKKFKQKGEYELALQEYKKVLESATNKAYVNAQIGECYRLSNRLAEAAPFYKAALDLNYKADSILFQYPFSLKAAGMYPEAKAAFQTYVSQGGKPARVERAQKEIDNLNKIAEIQKKKFWYEVSNLEDVNTPGSDFGPSLNENILYFASEKGTTSIFAQTGKPFTNIFSYKIGDAASLQEVPGINTGTQHEASATLSKDGKLMIFARSNDGSRKTHKEVALYQSRYNGQTWSEPELLGINDPEYWNGAPCLSPDGKTLYFASNRRGGKGGLDLYRTKMDESGKWGKVSNLGADINTPGDESFPFITEDGKLYFASDGQPSLGGLDIFMASKKGDATVVENLGTGINTFSDDFGLVWKSATEGYFSSNRPGGKGDDDIYYFRDGKNDPRIVKFVTNGQAFSKDDKGVQTVMASTLIKLLDDKGEAVAETTTDAEGRFSFPMEPSKNYVFYVEKAQYYTKREPFTTVGKSPSYDELTQKETTIELSAKLVLDKIKIKEVFTMENINYDYDKWDIRPDAAVELDKIVQFLNDNPTISIELSSHTDSRGDDVYNMKLSQKRAESSKAYIVSKGVDAKRITSKGYGESKPVIAEAATEEDFQKNRRTEFQVTKVSGMK